MWWQASRKQTARSLGFTIVEVMIVLAVTGAMFIAVATVINGKQQNTQFQTSVNEAKVRLSQVANEVASGYYPDASQRINCVGSGANFTLTARPASTPASGTCMLVGKALHFYDQDQNRSNFSVYSIIGADNGDGDYADIGMLLAAASNRGSLNRSVPASLSLTETKPLTFGLQPARLTYTPSGGTARSIGSFAFVQSLNANGTALSSPSSESQGASQYLTMLVFPDTTKLANNEEQEANAINTAFDNKTFQVAKGVVELCLNSGTTTQHALMRIGTATGSNSVASSVRNGSC